MSNEFLAVLMLLWTVIIVLILVAIMRYAVDSSRTSRKIDQLIDEVRTLRREMKQQSHVIDKKV
jgi:hypothetical protein